MEFLFICSVFGKCHRHTEGQDVALGVCYADRNPLDGKTFCSVVADVCHTALSRLTLCTIVFPLLYHTVGRRSLPSACLVFPPAASQGKSLLLSTAQRLSICTSSLLSQKFAVCNLVPGLFLYVMKPTPVIPIFKNSTLLGYLFLGYLFIQPSSLGLSEEASPFALSISSYWSILQDVPVWLAFAHVTRLILFQPDLLGTLLCFLAASFCRCIWILVFMTSLW